jgi:hypothetical protein
MEQKQIIAAHLKKHGRITSLEAIKLYTVTRLADVIYKLKKDGYDIYTERRVSGSKKTYARYHLIKSPA